MIKERTLLILGAGASCPYGYPSGAKLRKELYDHLKLTSSLNAHMDTNREAIKQFCTAFKYSELRSIDSFLAKRGQDEIILPNGNNAYPLSTYSDIGKLGIASLLFEVEKKNAELKEPDEDHWFQYLWHHLADDVTRDEFKACAQNLKIITFNYDRLLEQYLYMALINTYGLSKIQAFDYLAAINIVHVYGALQPLEQRGYGVKPSPLLDTANCIKVIPEVRNDTSPEFEKAKDLIVWANKIAFLGFSFDPLNVKRLGFPELTNYSKDFYLTQYGMTLAEAKLATHLLRIHERPEIIDEKFTQLKTLAYLREVGLFH